MSTGQAAQFDEDGLPKIIDGIKPQPQQDRLTVVASITHEHVGDEAHHVSTTNWKLLKNSTGEETYSRTKPVDEEWKQIDTGWFDRADIGCVIVKNLAGLNLTTNPTEEEKAEIDRQVIEVGSSVVGSFTIQIPPGWSQYFFPGKSCGLSVRCLYGATKARVTVIPK